MSAAVDLIDLLDRRARAARASDRPARYHFLRGDGSEVSRLDHEGLRAGSRAVADELLRHLAPGDRALLMYRPGLDFLIGFFGCLRAGVIAIPAFPPHATGPERSLRRLRSIASSGTPRAILCGADQLDELEPVVGELGGASLLATDRLEPDAGDDPIGPPITPDDVAFLQYTSGSTARPRGVMVRHENVLANLEFIDARQENDAASASVSWLPVHHDMGLIEGALAPLFGGYRAYLLAPASFLHRPISWLEAISRHRATNSGGPDFAYDLCVRRIRDADRQRLDLSSWRVAYNGAEPIRARTLRRFAEAFAPSGFRWSSFYPVYGLAESTLAVTGARRDAAPQVLDEPSLGLKAPTVGCGPAAPGSEVLIVDPDSRRPVADDGLVGEIWVRGASVAAGYWNDEDSTRRTFGARLADGRGPFLRTGDLGFLRDGDLFVCGRLKDVVIARGRKHHAQDLEQTIERGLPSLSPGSVAAFSFTEADEERPVVLIEASRRAEPEEWGELIRGARRLLSEEHALQVAAVGVVPCRTLPRTSSGKLQRSLCRTRYLDAGLTRLAHWSLDERVAHWSLDERVAAPAWRHHRRTG